MFCRHWDEEEIERFFTSNRVDFTTKNFNMSEVLFEKIVFGVTTLRLKCRDCNRQRFVEVLGTSSVHTQNEQ